MCIAWAINQAAPVPTPEDTQKQSGNTHPELILFSLMAYSYYFAVQHAAKDIKDQQSPTAHGLFHHTQLNYSINMPQKNINDKGDETARKDAENDVDMANAKAAGDPALKRTLGEAGFFDTAEKPVESEAPTPDIDDETLT